MKKIVALFAVVAATACTSPAGQLCLKSAECAGEDDPATFCTDAETDCNEDEDCATARDDRKAACGTEDDALANCLVANGTCDDVAGTDIFGVEALAADGACEAEGKASAECE